MGALTALMYTVVAVFGLIIEGLGAAGYDGTFTTPEEGGGEYCSQDTFTADCGAYHVINMTRATFGLTHIGQCITPDRMSSTCEVDALPFLHEQCSGKAACEVEVSDIDKHMVNMTARVCAMEYRLNLQAFFTCIPVETEPAKMCPPSATNTYPESSKPISLSTSQGYLASVTTQRTRKGSRSCPWHIRGETGQTIQITLMNFNKVKPSDSLCQVYAYVTERGMPNTQSKMMDCGSDSIQNKEFQSLTESVDVVFVNPSIQRNFVLRYKAVGCPDVKIPDGAKVDRKGNKTTITCDDKEWILSCQNGEWRGQRGDCDVPVGTMQSGGIPWPDGWGQTFTIVLILAVALVIAVVIVVVGVCVVRRRADHEFQPVSQTGGEYGVYGLQGPVVPTKCYYPSLPHPPGGMGQNSGSESSHYTTTIQRRQAAVPAASVNPSIDTFPVQSSHMLQQHDVTSAVSCPVHSCPGCNMGTFNGMVGPSEWQTIPIRRQEHIYESPKFTRKARHDAPYYHELDPREVERQMMQQQQTPATPVTPIPQEDELQSDDNEDTFPPPPPPLPPDNET